LPKVREVAEVYSAGGVVVRAGGGTMNEETRQFIAAREQQIQALLDPRYVTEYKRQQAEIIQNSINRLVSGEETIEPLPPIRQVRKRKPAKRKIGNEDRVDYDVALRAYQRAGGNIHKTWDNYVIMKGLKPGCDFKDLRAFFEEG
jgi:hypothetical protein